MCLNTKGKYSEDTEIKWSIISKSVMIIIFVEFIDQLIDYPINCASLISYPGKIKITKHNLSEGRKMWDEEQRMTRHKSKVVRTEDT